MLPSRILKLLDVGRTKVCHPLRFFPYKSQRVFMAGLLPGSLSVPSKGFEEGRLCHKHLHHGTWTCWSDSTSFHPFNSWKPNYPQVRIIKDAARVFSPWESNHVGQVDITFETVKRTKQKAIDCWVFTYYKRLTTEKACRPIPPFLFLVFLQMVRIHLIPWNRKWLLVQYFLITVYSCCISRFALWSVFGKRLMSTVTQLSLKPSQIKCSNK